MSILTPRIDALEDRKYAIHTLSAPIAVDTTDISDLKFNNLEIGKTYRITVHARTTNTDVSDSTLKAIHDSATLVNTEWTMATADGFDDVVIMQSVNVIFEATATTLSFDFNESTNSVLQGNGSTEETFVMLEELNDYATTTDWD